MKCYRACDIGYYIEEFDVNVGDIDYLSHDDDTVVIRDLISNHTLYFSRDFNEVKRQLIKRLQSSTKNQMSLLEILKKTDSFGDYFLEVNRAALLNMPVGCS